MKKLLLFFFFSCLISEVFANATVSQKQWRWRNDDGNEAAATWKAAGNTRIVISHAQENVRLRIAFATTPNPVPSPPPFLGLELNKNVAEKISYSTSPTGPFTTLSSGTTLTAPFVFISSSQVAGGTATTQQLGIGQEPFAPGAILLKGSDIRFQTTPGITTVTEMEYVIQPTTLVQTGIYYFRLDNIDTYDGLPSIEVSGNGISGSMSSKKANFSKASLIDDQVLLTELGNITDARVYIEAGFQPGDEISSGTLPAGITSAYNAATGALTFKGTASAETWQEIFRAVQFRTTSTNTADRTFKFVLGDAVSLRLNGKTHFYQFFNEELTWAAAKAAAAAKNLHGLPGYLTTITSQAESDLVKLYLQQHSWLAGTDDYQQVNAALDATTYADQLASQGQWHWAAGPEKGAPFAYTNWHPGEPNGNDGQNYVQMYAPMGTWDDFGNDGDVAQGYVVEYGGFANDPVLAIDHSRTLTYYQMPTPAAPVLADGFTNPTSNDKPTIEGITESDAAVAIYLDNTLVARVTADAQGKWRYTFTTALTQLDNLVEVTAAIERDNVSDKSAILKIVLDTTAPVFANTPSDITANSDLGSCGAVVTYTAPTATDPYEVHELEPGMNFYDYANQSLESQTSEGLPMTFNPTDGKKMAVFLVNEATTARIFQDVTLPASGPIVISYDLQYNNHNGSFSNNQAIAVEVRDAATNALLRTLFKTQPGDPLVKAMSSHNFDISEFAGQQVRLVLTDTNIQENYMDVLLDNVEITGSSLVNGSFEDSYTGWTISDSGNGTWGIGYGLDIVVTQTAGLASGALFPVGTTTNTFEATDANGNTSSTSFDVTIADTQNPVAKAQDLIVQLDATGAATITAADINNASTDNCSIATYTLDKTSFDCSNIGANTVTLTVTDASGNTSTATATVTVEDKTAPVAKAKDITVQLDATGAATITTAMVDYGAADICSAVTLALSKTAFDCSNIGANTVTLTVTDASGNTSTATATVTVEDKTAPVAKAKDITVQLDAMGAATITTAMVNNGTADICGSVTLALSKTAFDCSNVGANTVTLTVTDASGNTSTAIATVTVEDKVAPVALTRNITVQLNANNTVSITAADINNGSTDKCGAVTLALSKATFNCANVGANPVVLTVTDLRGNKSTATATVTVEDKIVPTITAPGALTVNVDAGKATATNVNLGVSVTADNCSVGSVTNNAPAVFPLGTTTVTWTVTDGSGNKATATQTVTVRRNIVSYTAPATIQVPIRTAFAITGLPSTVEVTYTDNTKQHVAVTWQPGNYNGAVAGTYVLTGTFTLATGTTNLDNVQAQARVEVQPNKVPTALALSKTSFHPNITGTDATTGTAEAIGLLSTTDADDNQHAYALVSGTGSTDNNLFEIAGNQLYLKSNKGLSGRSTFAIRVRSTDPYNNSIEQTFTLSKDAYAKAVVDLKIVDTFSPNGDGYNDKWMIPELRFYNKVEVEIFDRDGRSLFRSTNPEMGWDGKTSNGLELKGAVMYVVQIKDINLVKKGVVTILRK